MDRGASGLPPAPLAPSHGTGAATLCMKTCGWVDFKQPPSWLTSRPGPGPPTSRRDSAGDLVVPSGWFGPTSGLRMPLERSGSWPAGLMSGQLSYDRSERVGQVGAEDEVGEADLLPSPLDLLGGRRGVIR